MCIRDSLDTEMDVAPRDGSGAIIMSLDKWAAKYPESIFITPSGVIVMSHGMAPVSTWKRNFIETSTFEYIQAPRNTEDNELICCPYPAGESSQDSPKYWAEIQCVKAILTEIAHITKKAKPESGAAETIGQ